MTYRSHVKTRKPETVWVWFGGVWNRPTLGQNFEEVPPRALHRPSHDLRLAPDRVDRLGRTGDGWPHQTPRAPQSPFRHEPCGRKHPV